MTNMKRGVNQVNQGIVKRAALLVLADQLAVRQEAQLCPMDLIL